MKPEHITPESTAELDALLRAGVQEALACSDFATAFDAFRHELPKLAPQLAEMMPPEGERAIAFGLFREIWNHLPRPDHDWKMLPLPKPERNGSCPCGSGQKYKQCCDPLAGSVNFGEGEFSVLAYVLETVPVAQYKNLPFKNLSPEELAHVAQMWLDDGRDDAAAALLEALLAPAAKLDARHEFAFDILCDVYLELGEPDKRLALVDHLTHSPNRELKSAAMHRRCTMLADEGDYAAAWQLFKEAQRVDPDNPSLAHLEVVLLASQGEIDQAQARARFWSTRLTKQGYGSQELVAYLDKVARNPQVLLDLLNGGDFDEGPDDDDDELIVADADDIDALIALVEALPAPSCQHRLSPQDGMAGPLEPVPALAKLEAQWREEFWGDAAEEWRDPWEYTRWIVWLEEHPLAWQSFTVLHDLIESLDAMACPDDYDDKIDWLEEALLDHAVELLRVIIAANHAQNCTLAWGFLENRPALRLLIQLAEIAAGTEEELPLLEWLVLTLNPNDNTGHRVALVHRYCDAGRAAEALAVCERFPDDTLGGLLYGRVLALYLLDRHDAAAAALAEAKKRAPAILNTLTAVNPPTLETTEDEAWFYRMDNLLLWERTGALEWLRQVAGVKPAAVKH